MAVWCVCKLSHPALQLMYHRIQRNKPHKSFRYIARYFRLLWYEAEE